MDSTMANAEHSDSSGEENTWTRDQEVLLIAQELADPPTELCARAIMTQRNTRYVSVSESHQHTAEVCGVMSQVPKCDATPFVCSTSIAWDHISCGLWSAQDCRNKWISMAAEVRYYRTTLEVAVDLLSQCDTKPSAKEIKEVKKWNSEFMTPNETVSKAPSEVVAAEESFSAESMPCPECGRSFATPSGLTKHMKKHSGQYKLRCQMCEKVFPRKTQLEAHMMRHGSRKLKCASCEKQFTFPENVKRHARTCRGLPGRQEGKHTYYCAVCMKVFPRKDMMNDHVEARHSFMFQYGCGQCFKRYRWRSSRSKHVWNKH